MADGVNKVILIGNLGADPDHRTTSNGKDVTNIRLATSESWKDDSGNKQTATEWHRVVFWGRQAVVVKEYLTKGSQVYIEGKLKTRKYTDKDGVEKYATDVVASKMTMLGSRGQGQGNQGGNNNGGGRQSGPPQGTFNNDANDDIPF